MSEKMSIAKQNEILITWLLSHASYDFSRDKQKASDEVDEQLVSGEMDPLSHLRMINQRVNQEAVEEDEKVEMNPLKILQMVNQRVNQEATA